MHTTTMYYATLVHTTHTQRHYRVECTQTLLSFTLQPHLQKSKYNNEQRHQKPKIGISQSTVDLSFTLKQQDQPFPT